MSIAPRVSYSGDTVAIHRRGLLVLQGMLATVARNADKHGQQSSRYESLAENASFPADLIEALNRRVTREGRALLRDFDVQMRREEIGTSKTSRRRRVGVGVYFFDAPSAHDYPNRLRRQRRPRRA